MPSGEVRTLEVRTDMSPFTDCGSCPTNIRICWSCRPVGASFHGACIDGSARQRICDFLASCFFGIYAEPPQYKLQHRVFRLSFFRHYLYRAYMEPSTRNRMVVFFSHPIFFLRFYQSSRVLYYEHRGLHTTNEYKILGRHVTVSTSTSLFFK
jgi:hypothetical protein